MGHSVSPPLQPGPTGTARSQSDGFHAAISRGYKGSAGLLRGRLPAALGTAGFGSLCDTQDRPRHLFSSVARGFQAM